MIRSFVCFVVLMFLIRCTNTSENKGAKTTEETTINEEPIETKQDVPEKHFVSIMGMKFIPEVTQVHKGDTILFTNADIVDHDVTEEKTKAWTSSVIHPGKSWTMVASESSDYFCSIHVVMKGKIIVE